MSSSSSSTVDPTITALFGPVPDGLDLGEDPRVGNDIAVAALLAIATAAVVIRIACRRSAVASLKADDYTAVAALVFTYATGAMSYAATYYAAGLHVWAVTADDVVMAVKLLYIYSFIFAVAVTLTKCSILLLYARIFEVAVCDRSFRLGLWAAGAVTLAYPVTFMIAMGNCCQPVSYYWTRFSGAATGTCPLDVGLFFFVLAIVNLLIDAAILLVPIPQIWKLHMSRRKKMAVVGLLMLGGFVCCASVVRIYYIWAFAHAVDATWYMGPVCVWSAVEPSIGILSACLPNMRAFFAFVRRKLALGSSSSQHAAASTGKTAASSAAAGAGNRSDLVTWGAGGGGGGASGGKRQDDELHLTMKDDYDMTNMVTAGCGESRDSVSTSTGHEGGGILVRTEITMQRGEQVARAL